MSSERREKQDPKKAKMIMVALGIVVFALGIVVVYIYAQLATALADTGAMVPKMSSNFTYTNQTTEELVQMIQNQRVTIYSSYPLEHAFCINKLGKDNVAGSERTNFSMDDRVIKETIRCLDKDGNWMSYMVEFDPITLEYKESIRLNLPMT